MLDKEKSISQQKANVLLKNTLTNYSCEICENNHVSRKHKISPLHNHTQDILFCYSLTELRSVSLMPKEKERQQQLERQQQ